MRPYLALLLPILLLAACSRPKQGIAPKEAPGNYTKVLKHDAAMNAAIAQAKATAGDFVTAFHAQKPGTGGFHVKKPYPTPSGSAEHMWIKVIEEKDGIIQGVIDNDAEETKEVKDGDTVVLKLSEISDWKYEDGHKLIGGHTIRYFFERMTPAEREAFLKDTGLEL